jgi:hypothetical protein
MMIGVPYVAEDLDPRIANLIHKSLPGLDNEFTQLIQKTDWAEQYLFEYSERALIGLFNNAIVRHNDDLSTFQEYQVYDEDEHFCGRADLLIMHNDFELLLEAKKWDYDGKEDENYARLFKERWSSLIAITKQKEFFQEKQTFLGLLIFEYVSNKYLEEVKNCMRKQETTKGYCF